MKKIKHVLFISTYMLATLGAADDSNGPSLNARCPHRIIIPKNGTGVLFNNSCTTAYVLPPTIGSAKINALAKNLNLTFCPAVKSVSQVTKTTLNSCNTIGNKIEKMIHDFDPLDREIVKLRTNRAEAQSKMELWQKRFSEAEAELSELRQIVKENRKSHELCIEDFSVESPRCLEVKAIWDKAKLDVSNFRENEYRNLRDKVSSATEDFDFYSKRIEEILERYLAGITPMLDLQQRLSELNLQVMTLYREYIKLEGATGQISWNIGLDQLLRSYQQANPYLNINWSRLPLLNAEFISTIKDAETQNDLGAMPALKSAVIPGARPTGFSGMGAGQKVSISQTQPSAPTQASILMDNSISGQIVLTLAGACPYFDEFGEPVSNLSELAKHMTANLIYSYEVAAHRQYVAKYNLSNLLKRIEEKTKRGGFFATSANHSILDDGHSKEWFSIDFSANSSKFQYSPEEQRQITENVKKELLDKAIRQFAILNAGAATPPKVPDYIESGASTASQGLRKCFNINCQVGSLILGVADSIWGNSDATANFHRNNNTWVTESINGVQFVERSGSLSFDSK